MTFHAQGAQISRWKKPEMKTDKTLVRNKGNIKRIMFCQTLRDLFMTILEVLRISQGDTYPALSILPSIRPGEAAERSGAPDDFQRKVEVETQETWPRPRTYKGSHKENR